MWYQNNSVQVKFKGFVRCNWIDGVSCGYCQSFTENGKVEFEGYSKFDEDFGEIKKSSKNPIKYGKIDSEEVELWY